VRRKGGKFRRGYGWSFVCLMLFFAGLATLILISCAPDAYDPRPNSEPELTTSLGTKVWANGHDVDPDEIDEIFLERVEYLDHGEPPPFNLVILPAHCREYPDGLTYCGFENPVFDYMLAGYFAPESLTIEIHLMNGEWTLEASALGHEIDHFIKYWFDVDGWELNNAKDYTESQPER